MSISSKFFCIDTKGQQDVCKPAFQDTFRVFKYIKVYTCSSYKSRFNIKMKSIFQKIPFLLNGTLVIAFIIHISTIAYNIKHPDLALVIGYLMVAEILEFRPNFCAQNDCLVISYLMDTEIF